MSRFLGGRKDDGKIDSKVKIRSEGGESRGRTHSQVSSNGFFPSHVINICSGDAKAAIFGRKAANATATLFNGGKVIRRGSVAQVDGTLGCDRVSETLFQVLISFNEG